jgi:hypothetical protein
MVFIWNSFKEYFLTFSKLAKPKHQLDKFSDLSDKNGRFKIFW